MKTSQKLKLVAHRAIVKFVKDQLIDVEYTQLSPFKHIVNDSEFVERRLIFAELKKYGYPQFIISNDYEDYIPECSFEVKRGERESWKTYIVFNVNELQEYLNFIESDLTPLELIKENYESESIWSGAGRPFRNGNVVFQKRSRIIVECSGGLDI